MRFLLVDDDRLIRFSLKSMLLEICPFDCFITEASDGLEMINRCNEYDPDIAFVDIRMPNLDGISAVQKCKTLSPATTFVILTGYSDFEYAQKCIQLGVTDYILKPIDLDSLSEIVSNRKKTLSYQREFNNHIFQLQMHDIFHMPFPNFDQSSKPLDLLNNSYTFLSLTLFIDCRNSNHLYSEMQNLLISDLKSFNNQLLEKDTLYSIDYSLEGYLYITYKTAIAEVNYIKRKIEFICNSYLQNDLHIYLYYSTHYSTESLLENIRTVDAYSNLRMDKKPGTAFELCSLIKSSDQLQFYDDFSELISAFQNSNEMQYTEQLNGIYRKFSITPPVCDLQRLSNYVYCVVGIVIDSKNFKEFMKSFVMLSDEMYQNINTQSSNKIELIINYVDWAYTNDLSINQLAEKFDLTPNYISKLFHEKTNTKFIDYITDLRMKQAKKILIEKPDSPLKDIALMLGYYSPRHFSTIFKKYTDLSPSEYRKKYLQHSTTRSKFY